MAKTAWDAVSNLTGVVYADGSRVSLQYDALNRRTTMQDSGRTTTYAYSVRSELLSDTRPGGYVVSREFDAVGNRILLVDADGGPSTSTFDAVNRLSSLRDPDSALTTLQYDAASRRTTLVDANGVTRLYQYDAAGRVTTQLDQVTAGGAPIVTMIDGYDSVGNRVSRNKDGTVTTWLYDAAYRLTGQQQSGAVATFVYDPAGNIASKWQQDGNSPLTMTFDAANQITTMLQGSALTSATFDATGNMTGLNTDGVLTTYTFDDEDRLTGIASSGGVSTYAFDGDGLRRSAFEAGGVLTTFVWEGSDYLMEKTPSGTQARYEVLEGEVVSEKRSGVRRLYVPDPLGSTRGLIDPTQTQTDTFAFWPYGESQSRTGNTLTPFQFVGTLGYHLDATGLVYVRARYLDVVRGRWMTRDPDLAARRAQGSYVYLSGQPTVDRDASGLQPNCNAYEWPPGPYPHLPPNQTTCQGYLNLCNQGYVYACSAYWMCMNGGNLSGNGPGSRCVRGCLQRLLPFPSLPRTACGKLWCQHQHCFAACHWYPDTPFNWPLMWDQCCNGLGSIAGFPAPAPPGSVDCKTQPGCPAPPPPRVPLGPIGQPLPVW